MPLKAVKLVLTVGAIFGVLLVTLSFMPTLGTGDIDTWERWAHHADVYGMAAGYAANTADYPPYSSVILLAALRVSRSLGGDTFSAIKSALLLGLCLTSLFFWLWTKNFWLAVVLHLSLLLGSVGLSYLDIFFAPSLILSLWALKEQKLTWFAIFYSLACLTKWQPILIAPFIVVYLLNLKHVTHWRQIDFKRLAGRVLIPALVIFLLTLSIFGILPLLGSLKRAATHNFLSGNALNFNWIITHFLHVLYPQRFGPLIEGQARFIRTRALEITLAPRLLFLITYAITLVSFFRRDKTFEGLLLFALIGYWAYFIFNLGVHENHLFLAVILAAALVWVNRDHLFLMLGLMVMSNVNLFLFYGLDGRGLGFSRVIAQTVDSALVFSIFNVGFFLVVWGVNVFNSPSPSLLPPSATTAASPRTSPAARPASPPLQSAHPSKQSPDPRGAKRRGGVKRQDT